MAELMEGMIEDETTVRLKARTSDGILEHVLVLRSPDDRIRVGTLLRLLQLLRVTHLMGALAAAGTLLYGAFSLGRWTAALERPAGETAVSSKLRKQLISDGGSFAWQWAGENWVGKVVFVDEDQQGLTANLSIDRVTKSFDNRNGAFQTTTLAETLKPGQVRVSDDETEFEVVNLETMFKEFEGRTEEQKVTLALRRLRPVTAFIGDVDWQGKRATGGVVLVKGSWKQ